MGNVITKFMKRKKIMIGAIALIIVLLFAVNTFADKKTEQGVADANVVMVDVEEAQLTDSLSGLTYKADLVPAEEALVSCNASGQVTQVLFENGDKVTQGQALAYLDDKDLQNQLKTAKINLSKLQLDLNSARSDYNIAKELYDNGACSKTTFEDAELNYRTFEANVELKKIEIQTINNSISDSVICAAISGEIGDKSVTVGQYLNPGSTLATIRNNTSIKAEIKVMQDDLEKVTVGQTVTLKLSEKDEKTFSGVVETIAASADSQTRVFNCLIKIDNTSGMLNSGVTGYIEIPDKEKKQVLTVPMSAVAGSEGDYSLFTVKDHIARRVSVTIGDMSDELVEITSGIQEGDHIIITNLNSLQDGDKVTVSGEGK